MNITHETNQLDEIRSINDTNPTLTINQKCFISSDLNLWQRLIDWIKRVVRYVYS